MVPIIKIVDSPSGDWGVIYFHSNITDKKVWEGNSYNPNSLCAMAECFGYPVEFFEFTDEDEIDGETPDKFGDIKGIKKIH